MYTPQFGSRQELSTETNTMISGRLNKFFQGKYNSSFIQYVLTEFLKKKRLLSNYKWFIETYSHFCENKSEIFTFCLLASLSDSEISELEDFIKTFDQNYGRSLNENSLKNLYGLIENERKFRTQKGEVTVSGGLSMATTLSIALSHAVSGIQLKSFEQVENERKNRERRVLMQRKSLADAYFKRLTRRYEHLRKNYNISTNGEFTPKNAEILLRRFFDSHFGQVNSDEDSFLIPDFADMGASLDDANESIAHLLLIINEFLDYGSKELQVSAFVQESIINSSSRNMAIARFVEFVFQKEYERRREFEARKDELMGQLGTLEETIDACQRLADQVRLRLDAMNITYI